MKYAEVAVNSPIAGPRSFCYSIPFHLNCRIGQAVWVPFGSKTLQGLVIELTNQPSVEDTKEIIGLISPEPLLSPAQIELALWICHYYHAPLFDTVSLMLPPGFERKLETFLCLAADSADMPDLTVEQQNLMDYLKNDRGDVNLKEIERKFGKRKAQKIVRDLVQNKVITKYERLAKPKVGPKIQSFLKLELNNGSITDIVVRLRDKGAYKQAEVIEFLAAKHGPVLLAEIKSTVHCSQSVIKALVDSGSVSLDAIEIKRDPLAHVKVMKDSPPVLTQEQERVWEEIRNCLIRSADNKEHPVFLLKGVTGSGKTEIYLKAIAEALSHGKQSVCLVPEIALTPQTIERFMARFPGQVAIFHSGLSLGERFDEWYRIYQGEFKVVVGPRSALFSPVSGIGLIIIDEEHEWTYKQSDKSPRYHARDVAVKLAELTNAVVILGSATPDIESYYKAEKGQYRLVELRERVTPRGVSPLPEVEIVNLCDELRAGNRSLFSSSLKKAIDEVLARDEQTILFINRRGSANFVQCRDCGFVPTCSRCLVALTYHLAENRLRCHHCNFVREVPRTCPGCGGTRLRFIGIGTQKVEMEARSLFKKARILRWDSDVTTRRRAHEQILAKIKNREIDILIGTQIIAKGLDLPQVTLIGVINADTGLNLPDFRSAERTFQLTCQIAGRAGRGLMAGRVIVQTYNPEHYAIQAASRHDYESFYRREIEYRRQLGYPPFSQMARLTYSHTNNIVCHEEADRMREMILSEKAKQGLSDLRTIGPAPAFIPRVRGRYQWHIVVCGSKLHTFLSDIVFPKGWTIDIDPVSML
jgi:primosomal protein N' (replication factor Y)